MGLPAGARARLHIRRRPRRASSSCCRGASDVWDPRDKFSLLGGGGGSAMKSLPPLTSAELPSPSREREGCPTCGHPRTITTDGLTGRVVVRCETCEREAARAATRAAIEATALQTVARRYGLTPEELDRRARRRPPTYAPRTCQRCRRRFVPTGPTARRCPDCQREWRRERLRGRPPKTCIACGTLYTPTGNHQVRCAPCGKQWQRELQRRWWRAHTRRQRGGDHS